MNAKNINIAILLLFLSFNVFGNKGLGHELSKEINKEFKLNANGKLKIANKYGYVNIKAWDKEEVKIDVKIKVDAKSDKKAQELLDRIQVNFSDSPNMVSAETEIETDNNWGVQINYNVKFEINYDVFMPKSAFLDIANKYGNADIPCLEKDIDARIKYGKINFDDQNGNVNLSLGYGDAKMGSLANLNADIKYSELELTIAGNVTLDTKYSRYILGTVDQLNVESGYDNFTVTKANSIKNDGKYDDWKVGEVGVFNAETKYSDIEIDMLYSNGKFSQKYGDIVIYELGSDAQSLDFDMGYTDVEIKKINSGYTVNFDGSYADCKLHSDFDYSLEDEDGQDLRVKGRRGNGQVKINVETKYGDLVIR